MKFQDESVRLRHFDEVVDVVKSWAANDGLTPSQIVSRLFAITMSVLEGSGQSADDVCDLVRKFYALPIEDSRPVAKA